MNRAGANQTQLTNIPDLIGQPKLSPGGTQVVFTRGDLAFGAARLWVMNADGTDLHEVFAPPPIPGSVDSDLYPAWSPDGTEIAFVRSGFLSAGIYVMNADGSDPHAIVGLDPDRVSDLALSPDGTKIACAYNLVGPAGDVILIANLDGSGFLFELTGPHDPNEVGGGEERQPAW
jgi:dipeptidyl aminopeptidase/acylaminoacyl peptidase